MSLTIYSDQELKEIQRIETEALSVLKDVCDKLHISYFAIGGTALGAVRHNGFIPWDDDIDIGMTRENYFRFIKEAPSFLPSKYILQDPYSSQRTAYPYTKIRINGTSFVEYSNRNVDMHHGVYIDIFPFDEVPDDDERNKKQYRIVQRLSRIIVWRQSPDMYSEPHSLKQHIQALCRRILFHLLRLIPYNYLVGRIDQEITRYNGTNQQAMACLLFSRRNCEYGLKSTLFPLKEHQFENLTIPVPNDCDTYLTTHYGDWRKMPPREQRFGHKPYYINLYKAYEKE